MIDLGLPRISVKDLPLKTNVILAFISYLNIKGLAPSTTTTYISAISYVHKMNGLDDPTSSFLLQKVLASVNRAQGNRDSRLPITLFMLNRLLDATEHVISGTYNKLLIRAMFALSFFGLFRVGEITVQASGVISLYINQLKVFKDSLVISITKFKNNKTKQPFDIVIHKQGGIYCPYSIMLDYLKVRGLDAGPLFCFINLRHIPRTFFTTKLKNCLSFCGWNTKLYLSHSFRIGGASFLASIGMSDTQIKLMGRWSSDAFIRYIRNQRYHILKSKN